MEKNLTQSCCIKLWRTVRELLVLSALLCVVTMTNAQNCGDPLGTPGTTLDPNVVPKFVNPMPVIKEAGLRVDLSKGKVEEITVTMEETTQDLLGMGYDTKVWGYNFPGIGVPTYPGATIVAMEDKPVNILWDNQLPGHFLPVDASLHMAHPSNIHGPAEVQAWYAAGNVPTVTHLHGGHTESASDGLPEAWFTQNFADQGAYFVKQSYWYDNDQEAGTLWYHDHALGITRLNVYAGLAGFYLLRDKNEERLLEQDVLPKGDYEIEIVIQDRLFDTEGQLFWPAYEGEVPYGDFITGEGAVLPPEVFPVNGGPTALAEMFGNIMLVNGKAWPKLEVEPRKYRFRLLNGSDSRFYILKLDNGSDFMVIGTDDGLLESPVNVNELVFAPGERYDVVVDFTGMNGNITMLNLGPDEPYGGGVPGIDFEPACPGTTGQIMQFQVTKPLQQGPTGSVALGTKLRNKIMPLRTNAPARQLVLFEGMDEFGRLQPMLGTLANGSQTWSEAITENPALGATEMWEVYNATGDAHPIHLHLVSFQILNREVYTPYNVPDPDPLVEIVDNVQVKDQIQHNGSIGVGGIFHLDPVTPLTGIITDPAPHERGWKDTFIVLPGQVGRVVANFDRLGRYVWHCHILSHEDHEMMRPFQVGPIPAPAPMLASDAMNIVTYPNPFQSSTQVRFELTQAQTINFAVFDMGSNLVYQNEDSYAAGKHAIFWDGFGLDGNMLEDGMYMYKIQGADFQESGRLVISR